ncbi:MAG TPA: hemerythrin domain-containing protein [Steroidobacteraceae bacterium]|jgi:hemerythrin superfamily protein|nr:hemerythrin domain-containing protein [Steroidobacteraceae bacterium]
MEKSTRTETRARRSAASKDAIALLKADHRQVEKWFAAFKKARSTSRKAKLAEQICDALKLHTAIEEEIFYPAFLSATQDEDKHHEAEVEHEGAKKLIKTIEEMDADDDYFEARIKVLSEMIKHHVKEEEKPGGMFSEARKADMDLEELGRRMKSRKEQLQANGGILGLGGGNVPRLNA